MKASILGVSLFILCLPFSAFAGKQKVCASVQLTVAKGAAKCEEINNKACFSVNNETYFSSASKCKQVAVATGPSQNNDSTGEGKVLEEESDVEVEM